MEATAKDALGPLADELLSMVADGVITTDERGVILLVNNAAEDMFGYEAKSLLGMKIEFLLPIRYREVHQAEVQKFGNSTSRTKRAMARGREVMGLRQNGQEFPVEASLTRLTLGRRRLLTVVLRDVSERKQIEEDQRLITREMAHRLKNLLAVVDSVVSLSARGAESVEAYQAILHDRLQAIGRTVDLILRTPWSSADLLDLLTSELAPFEGQARANITLSGPAVKVPARWAISLTLALHELATNSAKYGALSQQTGSVKVSWEVDQGTGDPMLQLQWVEAGGPTVKIAERAGFGSDLISRALGRSNTRLQYHAAGLEAHLQVAL
jgi:PAS domain S-box-containing protein